MVDPNILQDMLKSIKIPIKIRKFIFKLMTDRNLYFKINHILEGPYYRHLGVLQGYVLSPILYLIYVIYLNKYISPKNDIIQFADDTIIITNNKFLKEGLKSLENNAKTVIRLLSFHRSWNSLTKITTHHFFQSQKYKIGP